VIASFYGEEASASNTCACVSVNHMQSQSTVAHQRAVLSWPSWAAAMPLIAVVKP